MRIKATTSTLIAALVLFGVGAQAQGLKGAPDTCNSSAFRTPPLIEGKSDKERWAKFLSVQPVLVGMKYADVRKALGPGKTDKALSYLAYAIKEMPGPAQPGKLAAINLAIDFEKGVVDSYRVESVRWSDARPNGQISSR